MKAGNREEYLIFHFEMLDLEPLIVLSFHLLLVELGAVVSLLPPFAQFNLLDLPFNLG